jgi:hypothetical protein
VPERPKGTGCKPVGSAYGGSNPPAPTDSTVDREAGLARFTLLTRGALAALLLMLAVDVASLLSDLAYHHLLHQAIAGNVVSQGSLSTADDRQHVFAWAGLAVHALTAVVFVAWFRGAYVVTEELGANLRWSSRWAAGAWFVPLLNLWRPKAIANDIWRGSDPAAPAHPNVAGGAPSTPIFLGVWWAAFVISGIAGRIAFQHFRSAHALSGLSSATNWVIASDAIEAVAAMLALAVVYATSLRLRSRELALADATEPTGFARGWYVLTAIGAVAVLAVVVGAPLVTAGSNARAAAPRITVSRLGPLALAPDDSLRIGTTDITCISIEDGELVTLACVPSSSAGPLNNAYVAEISDQAASLAPADTLQAVASRAEPRGTTALAVPKPRRHARTAIALVGRVIPVGGTSIVCTVQQGNGGTLVCGLVRTVSGPTSALKFGFVPLSYGIAINQVFATLIRWRSDGTSYRTETRLTEPD